MLISEPIGITPMTVQVPPARSASKAWRPTSGLPDRLEGVVRAAAGDLTDRLDGGRSRRR